MSVRTRSVARGYALAAGAATLWALNGSMARELLHGGLGAFRLAELRSLGSLVILFAVLAARGRRDLMHVRREDVRSFAFLGVCGIALVHAAYFVAIDRLQIGAALTIQYLAPLLLLLWLRFFHGRRFAPALWGAVALSAVGCFFVVRAYDASALDGLGIAAAFASAVAFAVYMVGSERAGRAYEPATTLLWAFAFASVFWAVVQPWWTFPFGELASAKHLALALGVIVIGTLLPFALMIAALRHLPSPRAAVVATLEPVLGALFAYLLLGESLAPIQLAGACAVIAAVAWVQLSRPDLEAESAPALASAR
jgi:drug/metabolite transporter (DMT)-like permease